MSRFDKLKRLKDEVNRLFYEESDEIAIIDRLRADVQFADASYEHVQAFYSHLQENFNAKAELQWQIGECEQKIPNIEQQILLYKRQITPYERQLVQQLNSEQLFTAAKYRRQIEDNERRLAKEQQMKRELELMFKYRQNESNFLIYDDSLDNWVSGKIFWQGRFLMTAKSGNVHSITVQDLLQGTTKSFTVQKVGHLREIHALNFPLVLLCEFKNSNRVTYLRLAKFNFESERLQIVHSFEFDGRCQVLINTSDTSKFLLQKENGLNECKLVDDQVRVGRSILLEANFNIYHVSYFDKQICSLKFRRKDHRLTQVEMLLYNLEQNETQTRELDSTPENINCFPSNNSSNFAWVRDTVFVAIQFSLTTNYAVISTSSQARNWKVIEFTVDLQINRIQSFVDGTLVVCSKAEEQRKVRIDKLQMHKPDFLRNMAWNAMIKLFKEAKIKNPYEEARQYLPLNSEIQPFMITEG